MESVLQQLTRGNALLFIVILGIGGSFQSGYHLTSLSSPTPFIQNFINSSWYHRYQEVPHQQSVTTIWSLVVSLYAVGGLLGSVSIKFITDVFGRKKGMICSSLASVAAGAVVLLSKRVESFEMIIVARILFGFSAGLGVYSHQMYLSEMSPRKIRGNVTMTSATFTTLGKLCGQLFGLSEMLGREQLWNVLLSVPACFSVLYLLLLPFIPEAPRYLFIEKGDEEGCRRALQSLWGRGNFKQEMDEMLAEQAAIDAARSRSPLQLLRDRTVRWQLLTLLVIVLCNQLSGMPVVNTFSFDIFQKAGIPADKIRYATLGLGVAELFTSISCGLLIEHTGRRPLLWGAYGVLTVIWVVFTVLLNIQVSSLWSSYLSAALIVLLVVFFCGGPSTVTATLNSEIFVQSNRLAAFVVVGMERWLIFGLMGFVFPFLFTALDSFCFVIFACNCLLGSLYVFFVLPETKGKTLLQISQEFRAITVCGRSLSEEKAADVATRL
ncbi:solute carrier family 2 member 9, like 1 [Synchiropus splendidus]|uniref:solute carrier family 2 member 9, like 1 n=1 Tax=Synchiropus splendidus TaxID=270530 RepID=UPI00237DC2A1|nr:solute carrier family 2 member 9, like 1 [Synchiropus splendidus]